MAVLKPRLSFWQIWNMSLGFMGIQFGFALQNANTSRIFLTLGANVDEIPILWVAAPLTGLLVQPVIGYLSDRTWHPRWGRRRPFFFIGAILASLALIAMPNAPSLWVAGVMLWVMDASINVSMEPFRAFVGDMLPDEQNTSGFAMQSFFIGIGAIVASSLPALLTWWGVPNTAGPGLIPESVKWSYYLGAVAFFGCVLYTVLKTSEYPPTGQHEPTGILAGLRESFAGVFQMPKVMKQLAWVQFFTWFGLFCMWIYTTSAITGHVFGTTDTASAEYNRGANFVGIAFAVYNGVSAVFSLFLPFLAKNLGRTRTHLVCLMAGGLGLASLWFATGPVWVLVAMSGVGIAWASILSMPYAMLASVLPAHRMGYFMGVFNFFIVIPQVFASLGLAPLMSGLGFSPMQVVVAGGIFLMLAGLLTLRIKE